MGTIMKIKSKVLLGCLILGMLSSSKSIASQATATYNFQYFPILDYQKSLSKMLAKFIASILYHKENTKHITEIIEMAPEMSRNDALSAIKETTTSLFDPLDENHLSIHLDKMEKLTKHLDFDQDVKTINAINFLLEHQHRSSIVDTLFWIKAIKDRELDTAIPMTIEVANKPKVEKLSTLRKKMNLPID